MNIWNGDSLIKTNDSDDEEDKSSEDDVSVCTIKSFWYFRSVTISGSESVPRNQGKAVLKKLALHYISYIYN